MALSLSEADNDGMLFVRRAFDFVNEQIKFGGDLWQVKASETLMKSYGACYNKNLLLVALLRAKGIRAIMGANPMKHTFMKPAMGAAHVLVSNPFYHCFTTVFLDGKRFVADPTLDSGTYQAFFAPLQVDWNATWIEGEDMVLYTESVAGPAKEYRDIDRELRRNLDSHFICKNEPAWLLKWWLKVGNARMWKKIRRKEIQPSSEKTNSQQSPPQAKEVDLSNVAPNFEQYAGKNSRSA